MVRIWSFWFTLNGSKINGSHLWSQYRSISCCYIPDSWNSSNNKSQGVNITWEDRIKANFFNISRIIDFRIIYTTIQTVLLIVYTTAHLTIITHLCWWVDRNSALKWRRVLHPEFICGCSFLCGRHLHSSAISPRAPTLAQFMQCILLRVEYLS